ncbi:tripartite tricarboxylate transporter TctB family protein [bacterium]|nr:tripartite tricarboxylate transporter TctB family protein [bacterium]
MKTEKAGALILLMFSIAYGLLAFKVPLTFLAQRETFNARTMPFALGIIGTLLSFLILVLPSGKTDEEDKVKDAFRGLDWSSVGLLIGIMIFYSVTLRFLGFVISSIIFLVGGFYILGERRIWLLFISSVPLVLFIWFLMSRILGMYIAPGEIFYLLGVIK